MSRRRTLRTAQDLLDAGLIRSAGTVERVAEAYAVALTPAVVDLIDPADSDDPIARQYVPSAEELATAPEERADPIGDAAYSPVKGLVHRYPDRVLLTPLLVCPVYCRFCFRRARVGDSGATMGEAEIEAALAYVAERPEIREVILTGGDPLMLPAARLAALLGRINAIPHVELIRIHSRVPVSDPRRVTPGLARVLGGRGEAGVAGGARQPPARVVSPGRRRPGAAGAGRGAAAVADRAAQGRQRPGRGAGGTVPRPGAQPGAALLPAPSRPGARHRPLPPVRRRGPGADASFARPPVGHRPAHLRARHSRRRRQGAGGTRLLGRGGGTVTDPAGGAHRYPPE
ncbi:lysine 2,3-aminomutase [Paramagnetospirillum caucaseum]|uniref:Lysine 2,3-aminomutase n=1 Tax=Paramagnetospirillum caucaseum TaxID=1244869 RepID=M3ABH2_9PROT|nr:lysine 2,3-aminomutase [Paramagnetospirillum caucaseum]